MKKSTLPPLRVEPAVREMAESLLADGETLSAFVLEAVQLHIRRRETQRDFVARGLRVREEAREADDYLSGDAMLQRLDAVLTKAGKAAKVKSA